LEFILETKQLIRITGVNSAISSNGPLKNSFADFLEKKRILASPAAMDARKLVCIDYSFKFRSQLSSSGLDPKDCTLVRMEPSVVLPANFALSRRRQFGTIITAGGKPNGDSFSVHWPMIYPSDIEIAKLLGTERSDRVVLINGNKISFVKGELYSLRRVAIREVKNLDLFGTQWDSKFLVRLFIAIRSLAHTILSFRFPHLSGVFFWFRSYINSMGPVDDKLETMSRYMYALVIENSAEYMSEKLMEALFAGCIPIYVGPDPEEFGIPKDLVLWAEPNIQSIQKCLEEASSWEFADFHSRLDKFLSSPINRNLWDHEQVFGRIMEQVQRTRV
jgi:hypothetical protein